MKISSHELELLIKKHGNTADSDYWEDIKRLSLSEPLDYVLGDSRFLGCSIDLSFKPLIPRVETEYWVEQAISENKGRKGLLVLDIFSGSGCIGIAAAKKLLNSRVFFADSEDNCIKQIRKNIKLNKVGNKVKVMKSDIFKSVPGKFDIIFANPPYIPVARKKTLPKSVVRYEAEKYLFSGADGLSAIKSFIRGVSDHLKPGGVAYMEFDSGQRGDIKKLLLKAGLRGDMRKDQYGKHRWVKITGLLKSKSLVK